MGQSAGQSIGWTADDSRGCVPPRKGRIAKLITRRVEGSNPSPRIFPHAEKGFRKRANSSGALGPVVNLHFHLHLRSWLRAVRASFLPVIGERGAISPVSRGRHSILNHNVIRPLSIEVGKKGWNEMKTFGQAIREARKAAGLTQKTVAEHLRRGDGRKVLPPYLNDLEHDRRYPPESAVIEQLTKILKLSPGILYFYAKRVPDDLVGDFDDETIVAAYRAYRETLVRC